MVFQGETGGRMHGFVPSQSFPEDHSSFHPSALGECPLLGAPWTQVRYIYQKGKTKAVKMHE